MRTDRKKRNKVANRNFFIITVGFSLMLIVMIFGVQDLMLNTSEQTENRTLHCEIENATNTPIPCKLKLDDIVLFDNSIPSGKTSAEFPWRHSEPKTIAISSDTLIVHTKQITITDSISYLMIQFHQTEQNSLTIESHFFE